MYTMYIFNVCFNVYISCPSEDLEPHPFQVLDEELSAEDLRFREAQGRDARCEPAKPVVNLGRARKPSLALMNEATKMHVWCPRVG